MPHEGAAYPDAANRVVHKVEASAYEQVIWPEAYHWPAWIAPKRGAIVAQANIVWPAVPILTRSVLTQAEITTVCALRYIRMTYDDLAPVGRYLRLDALMEHCEALPAFVTTYPPDVAYPMGEQGAVR